MYFSNRFGILRYKTAYIVLALLLTPLLVDASDYTRTNFLFTYHDKPATFTKTAAGGFVGVTENGTAFTQTPIISHSEYRLHRFQIEQAFFYVSDKGTFQASNDLVALSIYSYLQGQTV